MDVEKIVRKYLDKTVHMSLATSRGSKPWVCEVHFAYDQALNLYFVSERSTRHCKEIADNPFVAGDIVRQHDLSQSPHGIYFEGSAELVADPSSEQISSYCGRLNRDESELRQYLSAEGGRGMYKISVSNWAAFGKFGGDKNQKYELAWSGGDK